MSPTSHSPAVSESRGRTPFVATVLVLAIVAAYANSLGGAFVFDDPLSIVENPSIRKLWPLSHVLLPPRGEGITVEGRPMVNLSLALNYAVGGTDVRGYHVVNTAIHIAAALVLMGLVRRTLLLPRLRGRFGGAEVPLAALIALLWALHPLQTESVTYIAQRAESLATLFYLLTLYCFARGMECHLLNDTSPFSGYAMWMTSSVLACTLGIATKEIMVSAPLLVLLFDRVFVAGSLAEVWRRHGKWHLALFATWLLLAALVWRTGTRGGTAGFGISVTPWQYALTQFEAVTRYLRLAAWPHPLIFDYGTVWVQRAADVLPYAAVLVVVITAAVAAWWHAPMLAWLALLFFAVLSPTSSFVPGNRQTIAEHRMYLPLAAVITGVVAGAYSLARDSAERRALFAGGVAIAMAFGALTVRRNEDYRSELVLYRDTALKQPQNGFARYNLGKTLAEAGRHAEALPEYQAALRLLNDAPGVHNNLANSLAALGRPDEAMAHFEAALQRDARYPRAHYNLANLLVRSGRTEEAARHFAAAADAEPEFLEARANLGGVLLDLRRLPEARRELETVLRRDPQHVLALFNLGNVNLLEERWADAAALFAQVLALQPDLTVARERLDAARAHRR